MKDTLFTAFSVVAVIALSVGIGELAFLGYEPGHHATGSAVHANP